MNIHHQKHFRTGLVSATVLVILAGVFVARTAFAKIAYNTIDPNATVSDSEWRESKLQFRLLNLPEARVGFQAPPHE